MDGTKKKNLILFIHGFTGSKDTWESNALEKRIPKYLEENAEIAANFDFAYFEYYSELIDKLNGFKWLVNLGLQCIPIIGKRLKYSQYKKNLPLDKIKELLVTDINHRHQEYDKIVLIAHSYGGLVAKSAVLKLIELNSGKISAYITLATPHFGTNGAKLASEFLKEYNLKNSQLADMKPLSEVLMSLTHQWLNQMNKLPISLYCLGFQDNIVPDVSAVPFDTRDGVLPVPSNHDHLSILIPTDSKDSILVAIQNKVLESLNPKTQTTSLKIQTDNPLKVEIVNNANTSKNLVPKQLTKYLPNLSLEKIIGRRNDIEALRDSLTHKRQVVLVNGLGGIGKTTLAQVYVSHFFDEYHHIAWLTQTTDDFSLELDNDATLLHNLDVSIESFKGIDLFFEVMRKMNTLLNSPNLLIIDNATQSLEQIKNYLPTQPNWHILVTSREELEGFESKQLDFLDEEDAINLFKLHCSNSKFTDTEIKELVQSVELHTLTIEILAKTATIQHFNFEQLKNALTSDSLSGAKLNRSDNKPIERVTTYLSSIFSMSRLNEEEILLLKQFCCFPNDYIAYDILTQLLDLISDDFAIILDSLVRKGWIIRNTENYKLHVIISQIIIKQHPLSFSDMDILINNLIKLLDINKLVTSIDLLKWKEYGQSFIVGLNHLDQMTIDQENRISVLYNNYALVLQSLGNYEEAKAYLYKALQSSKKNLGIDHPTTATRYSNYALVLQKLGHYEEAKAYLYKALQSDEKNLGIDHPTTAVSYSNYALVLKDLGHYEEAKAYLYKALVSNEKNLGLYHPNTATSSSNYAMVLKDLGNYEEAKAYLYKAVLSNEKNLGVDHPNTATSYSNYALILQDLGNYKEAKDYLFKALLSAEKNFGIDHPTTATSYSNYALVLKDLGNYKEAKLYLYKALLSAEKNFGIDHPTTAIRYSNYATVLRDLGNYEEAKVYLYKALVSNEKNFGLDHPNMATSYSNYALVLKDLGNYEEAKTYLNKALLSDEKNLGIEHPSTAVIYSNYAVVLQDLGNYKEAKDYLSKAYQIMFKSLGEKHPNTITVKRNLDSLNSN